MNFKIIKKKINLIASIKKTLDKMNELRTLYENKAFSPQGLQTYSEFLGRVLKFLNGRNYTKLIADLKKDIDKVDSIIKKYRGDL